MAPLLYFAIEFKGKLLIYNSQLKGKISDIYVFFRLFSRHYTALISRTFATAR